MALSAQQPEPENDRLDLLVMDALRLWKGIPDNEISGMVEEAIIKAGNFVATAGLVAQCWRESEKKELNLGDGARMSLEATRQYVAGLLETPKASPEFVSAFVKRVCDGLEKPTPEERPMSEEERIKMEDWT